MSPRIPQDPARLKALGIEELPLLADELRQRILAACLKNGGHLGASLGAVELAIALHRVFDSPAEPIIWDVGHQAYAHKLLTGRAAQFDTLRTTGGISGFLSRAESAHDVFGAGHSSTSISAALAMAWTRGQDPATRAQWSVAVIGDGGLTAGLALEALTQVSSLPTAPLLIVLNDNQMSISANVGGIASLLSQGRAGELFELLGCDYLGPVDGHDLSLLIGTLDGIRRTGATRPVVLHVMTQKGKGYAPAEEHPSGYHGISPVAQAKLETATQLPGPKQRSFSEAFGAALVGLAERDERVVAVTAAMSEGTGLSGFARKFPERLFDVGIAEPHAVTFGAGLAAAGMRPVVAIYSTFLQRGLDGIIHDVALQGLPVTFAIDRAGLVGADGPTHHGAFDLAYLGMIPGLTVYCPATEADLQLQLERSLRSTGPTAIRYPRGTAPQGGGGEAELRVHHEAKAPKLQLLALGSAESRVAAAYRGLPEGLREQVSFSTVLCAKPFPGLLLERLRAAPHVPVLWVEDGTVRGGAGQALLAEIQASHRAEFRILGYPDAFVPHGAMPDLERALGLSPGAIRAEAERLAQP